MDATYGAAQQKKQFQVWNYSNSDLRSRLLTRASQAVLLTPPVNNTGIPMSGP